MAKKYLLSVCIPTFNRENFIIKGLEYWENIPHSEKIEIIVANDCSDDNTDKKMKEFIQKNSKINLVYKKFEKRQGFDRMVLSIAKLAHGKFCWLISDDDLPSKNSLSKIFSIIKKFPEVSLIHLNYSRFDNILKKVTAKKMVGNINKDIYFNEKDEFFFKQINNSYFKYLGTNVITMSTDIINRKKWLDSLTGMEKFVGYNFMHCFVIAKMIAKDPHIYYNATPIVQYLSNNHRIWPNDIWKDYNGVFLNFLKILGFSKKKLIEMRESQKKYEKRENVMKHPILKYLYNITRPIHSKLQFLFSRIDL